MSEIEVLGQVDRSETGRRTHASFENDQRNIHVGQCELLCTQHHCREALVRASKTFLFLFCSLCFTEMGLTLIARLISVRHVGSDQPQSGFEGRLEFQAGRLVRERSTSSRRFHLSKVVRAIGEI